MKYWEIVADRLHAEGWSYGIAEHLTIVDSFFASMRTAMENDSSRPDDLLPRRRLGVRRQRYER